MWQLEQAPLPKKIASPARGSPRNAAGVPTTCNSRTRPTIATVRFLSRILETPSRGRLPVAAQMFARLLATPRVEFLQSENSPTLASNINRPRKDICALSDGSDLVIILGNHAGFERGNCP